MGNVKLSQVYSFPADNVSRPNGFWKDASDKSKLIVQMLAGWLVNVGGIVILYKLDAKQVKAAMEGLAKQWEEMRNGKDPISVTLKDGKKYTLSPSDVLREWESIYTKDGKIIAPEYGNVICFRRLASIPFVNAVRRYLGQEGILEIPAQVQTFASDKDRHVCNVQENALKTEGRRVVTSEEFMTISVRLYNEGCREADLQKIFGTRYLAQKYFALASLNHKHPSLGLAEGIAEKRVKFEDLDKEAVRKLHSDNASLDEVTKYLADPRQGKENAKPMAKASQLKELRDRTKCDFIRFVLDCVINNEASKLGQEPFTTKYEELNKLTKPFVS